jgi:hypothetical protein
MRAEIEAVVATLFAFALGLTLVHHARHWRLPALQGEPALVAVFLIALAVLAIIAYFGAGGSSRRRYR